MTSLLETKVGEKRKAMEFEELRLKNEEKRIALEEKKFEAEQELRQLEKQERLAMLGLLNKILDK